MAEQQKLRVGVFIPAPVQFLDLGAADIIAMLDPAYLASCQLPPPLVAMGIPTTIDYISTPESGDCVPTTASANIHVTKTIDDPSAQAGSFDIVLVPGPDPATIINEKARAFLKSHADWMGDDGKTTDILSVCTGCFIAGQAGVFKGKKASGPRPVVGTLQKLFPDTEWINDKRWVNDGNIWSSGGVTNGLEMAAEYLRQKFPAPLAGAIIGIADVGNKGIDYPPGEVPVMELVLPEFKV